ncbi:MAG: Bcr/CflA family multidrug efflux MFS transporter [Azospirillaceae bacterium]|nr:Bcr/CflA family multidrug efflux MFS transporter [Azospirillaceae bacterium]
MLLRLGRQAVPGQPAGGPLFLIALSILMCFGPMAVDMYLPALPTIGTTFHARQDQVQWSLSAFFLGFGVGQLFWGSISDALGRRWPGVAGILIYVAACIGCCFAGSITQLAEWRFLQALGACAGPVVARAMVGDLFSRDRSASILSLLMLIMGVAPMMAPLVGGQILMIGGWRSIFLTQAAFGAVATIGLFSLPETLSEERRSPARLFDMLSTYVFLLRNRRFLGYALSTSLMFAGMFTFISGSPFVYIDLYGVHPENYGYLFGVNIVGMMLVNTINRSLVMRVGIDRALRVGCIAAAATGILLLAAALTGAGGLAGLVAGIILFMSTVSMIGANGSAGAMGVHPQAAGAASALAGLLQFGGGAIAGLAVGWLANGTAIPLAAIMAASGILTLLVNILLLRRQ